MNRFELAPVVLGVVVALAGLAACDRSPDKQSQELAEKRATVEQHTTSATIEANDKAAAAYKEADDKIAKEQGKLTEKAIDVSRSVTEARDNLRKDMLTKLADDQKRLVALQTKIATSKTLHTPRAQLDREVGELQGSLQSFQNSVGGIYNATEASFSDVKKNLQDQSDKLSKWIDDVEQKL